MLVSFQKVRGNLLDMSAQDLLGKSHEELVLMLIHLRRQSAALNESLDAAKWEKMNKICDAWLLLKFSLPS